MIVHSHNHRQTRRSRLDAYEVSSTGGLPHIGHLVAYWDEIENWRFGRCRCGFNLALTPTGEVIWLRAANRACEIVSFEHLLRALAADCWHHPRAKPKNADSLSAPTIAAALSPALATQPPAPALAPADPISRGSRVETKIPESLPPTRSSESSPGISKSQTRPVRRLQIFVPSTARGQRKAFAKAR